MESEKENIQKTNNKQLLEEIQDRIIANSLSEEEINDLTFAIIEKMGKSFLSEKFKQTISFLEDENYILIKTLPIRKNELEKEDWKKRMIAAHQRISQNRKLRKELAIWDETVDDYIAKK